MGCRRASSKAPLIVQGVKYFSDYSKAEQTASHFQSQFSNSDRSDTSTENAVSYSIHRIHQRTDPNPDFFSVEQVRAKICYLNPKKSPGHDGIPNKALRMLDPSVIPRLTSLFSAIIVFHHVPHNWKVAVVVPVPKGQKDPTQVENKRPISLLCGFTKIFESLLKDVVQDFADDQNLIPAVQFGFQRKLAAIQQAANLLSAAALSENPRWKVITALLDVEKAYDRAWRQGLLHKLWLWKFPLWLLKVLQDWLQDRTFYVRIGSSLSQSRPVLEGLPQGSPLSPVLFNLFVADLPTFQKDQFIHVFQFADDTAVVARGKSVDVARDRFERGVGAIISFAQKWKIRINQQKTEVMLFGRKRPAWPYARFDRRSVRFRASVKYLGIIIDRRKSFLAHVKRRAGFALDRCRRLFPILCTASKLSVRNRRRLFSSVLFPCAFYGLEMLPRSSIVARKIVRQKFSRLLRRTMGAPWFIRTSDLMADLDIEDILTTAERRRREMVQRLLDHESVDIKKKGEVLSKL